MLDQRVTEKSCSQEQRVLPEDRTECLFQVLQVLLDFLARYKVLVQMAGGDRRHHYHQRKHMAIAVLDFLRQPEVGHELPARVQNVRTDLFRLVEETPEVNFLRDRRAHPQAQTSQQRLP